MAVANVAVMVWVWTFAVLIVAVLLVAGSLHMWLPGVGATGGWTIYMPLADRRGGVQFLGNEQFWQLQAFLLGRWILPIAALVLVGLSAWSWRRGRV